MSVLLDTHILLWWLTDNPQLSQAARDLIEDTRTTAYISSVSIWELVIKQALGKLPFDAATVARSAEENGLVALPFDQRHALAVATLPDLHKDPFDRALIAQSMAEPLILLTADTRLARYGAPIRLV